ncbi:hypothetical protein K7432_013895 [Basidiobolus ranarum]|uniref:C2H2-type domain-containing protein n=1 Tax=Basidiobolus ranarum TaxID=34480 RepID=A0ABR2VQC7_9FUNG
MLLNYDDDSGVDLFEKIPQSKRVKRERRHTISTVTDYSPPLSNGAYTCASASTSPVPSKLRCVNDANDRPKPSKSSGCFPNSLKTDQTTANLKRIVVSQTDKVHICTVAGCDMRFKRLEHLKRHHRIHTMERPFSCSFPGCGKAFSRQDNLRQHTRTHQRQNTRSRRHVRQQTL